MSARSWIAVAERSGDTAFVRAKPALLSKTSRPGESSVAAAMG
jgi:hypothetical protein